MTDSVHIQTTCFTGASAGPHLVIFGGVHGDEYEPMAAVRRLAKAVTPSSLRGRLTLAPVVNEAAFRRGQRVAEDGLDLARTFPGHAEGSITQRVAHAAGRLIREANYFIDLHTGGTAYTLLPMVGYMLHSNSDVLAQQRSMARAFNLPVVWGTSAELDGRSTSFARDANIPAIYAEYFGGGSCRPDGVSAYVEGCLNVMACLGMIERERPADAVRIVAEDRRPESGHLQRGHPSPSEGYFEPAVQLGQRLHRGDLLGTVCDSLGKCVEPIRSNESGVVLMLRALPSVQAGDALAVVIETEANEASLS